MRTSILATSVLLVAASFAGGCANVRQYSEADKAIAAAEQEQKAAKAAKNVWSNSEQLLADAKKARENFRPDEALKLAKQSLDQFKLAEFQARDAASAKPFFNGQ